MGVFARLARLFSRAPRSSGGKPKGLPPLSLWQQFQRIGGSLTPAHVSNIIREADQGYTARLIDLANESRQRDGHLQSVLWTRESAVPALAWELYYPGAKRGSTKGSRQLRFVKDTLEGHPGMRDLIAHLAGAVFYGYAVAEIVWAKDGDRLVPERFELHSPRRFGFRDEDGRLVWRDQTMPREGVDFIAEFPDRFIVSQPRINGDVPCREGLVRVLLWAALFRNWTMADWLKLAELSWKPWRLGKYAKGSEQEDIDHLVDILELLTTNGIATHPEGTEVTLVWPGQSGSGGRGQSNHAELFEVVGREISKATVGQTLTTEQGNVGTQALGTVHENVRRDIRDADAQHIAAVLNRWLIPVLVRLNFGPSAPVPVLRFVTEDAADLNAFSQALDRLCGPNVKMRIGAAWARDRVGIPEPEDDDELLGAGDEADEGDEPEDEPGDDPPTDDEDEIDVDLDEAA